MYISDVTQSRHIHALLWSVQLVSCVYPVMASIIHAHERKAAFVRWIATVHYADQVKHSQALYSNIA